MEPNDERLGRTWDSPKAEGGHPRPRGCHRGWIVGAATRSATTGRGSTHCFSAPTRTRPEEDRRASAESWIASAGCELQDSFGEFSPKRGYGATAGPLGLSLRSPGNQRGGGIMQRIPPPLLTAVAYPIGRSTSCIFCRCRRGTRRCGPHGEPHAPVAPWTTLRWLR